MDRFKNCDQFKAFIKNEARKLNISVPNAYSTFIARTFLEKLSKKNTSKSILIKGSSAETAYLGGLVRGITDVDLASIKSIDICFPILEQILSDETVNDISFKLSKKPHTTKTGIHKFTFETSMGKVNNNLNVDFQDKYGRLIEQDEYVMPPIFDGDKPFLITTPSFEEYLAEKLCIILENNKTDVLNTRLKDFYDIYELHGGKYDVDKLTHYFKLMLALRAKIRLEDSKTDYLDQRFVENHKEVWESARKKYDFLDKEIDLGGAVYYTRAVLREYLQKNGVAPQETQSLQKVNFKK